MKSAKEMFERIGYKQYQNKYDKEIAKTCGHSFKYLREEEMTY